MPEMTEMVQVFSLVRGVPEGLQVKGLFEISLDALEGASGYYGQRLGTLIEDPSKLDFMISLCQLTEPFHLVMCRLTSGNYMEAVLRQAQRLLCFSSTHLRLDSRGMPYYSTKSA